VFYQLVMAGVATGCIYALVALGLTIIFNSSSLVNLAQGELLMAGGLSYVSFAVAHRLPFALALPLAMACAAWIAMAAEGLVLRPLRVANAPIVNAIVMTIGLSMVLKSGGEVVWGKTPLPAPSPVSPNAIWIGAISIAPQSLLIAVSAVIAMGTFWFFFEHTLIGRALQAVSTNREAAWVMGINANRVVLLAFGLSGALSALAGVLVAPITAASPTMGTMLGLKGVSAAIIGGFGSLWGAVVGGVLLGISESLTAGYLSSGLSTFISFGLVLLVLFVKPAGLLPTRR
jgi:branched-chain amino acid transport system permease protein